MGSSEPLPKKAQKAWSSLPCTEVDPARSLRYVPLNHSDDPYYDVEILKDDIITAIEA